MTDILPPAGYAAGTPRPAIGFSIDVPDHWTVLDLNPETWDPWLDAFLDTRGVGPGQVRTEARQALLDLLRRLHDEKVFMAAILAADVAGELVSASATLAWRQVPLSPEGIPVDGLYQVYAAAPAAPGEDLGRRRVEVVQLPAGPAVWVATRERLGPPTTEAAHPVDVIQYYVPVGDSDWLAAITVSTGQRALAPGVAEVAETMARSLRFTPGRAR